MSNCLKCSKSLSKRQRCYCSNKCKLTHSEGISRRTKPKEKQDPSKEVVCKLDGKRFSDAANYSGVLTRHLKSLEVVTDNVFEYFDIVDKVDTKKARWKCKYCDWSTVDVGNKSGCITVHIKTHKVSIEDHITKYPEDEKLWIYRPTKDVAQFLLSKDPDSYIICQECGSKFKRISRTHLKQHDMTLDEYRDKYNISILSSKNVLDNMREVYYDNLESINHIKKTSKSEEQLYEFLTSKGIVVLRGDRKVISPFELDLYLPDYKVAIEVNGLYWHSEYHGRKHKNYHLDKLEACEKQGVRLIHIFEDEWKAKRGIMEAKILSILGFQENRVYARNCELREIDRKVKSEFLNKNHIQSDDKAAILLGLYFKEELVAVMTFGELRKALGSKKEEGHYELIRFCTSCNVIGGASKLLSYFVKSYKPKAIISYADRRFTTTVNLNLYDKIGFKLAGKTKPNYWYTKDFNKKLHRYNFNKGRLVKEFGADQNKSETQIMYELGYDRVWDCGNLKYYLQIDDIY